MLGVKEAIATVAVKDIAVARKFYEGKLGLTQIGNQGEEMIAYQTGKTRLNVYHSTFAGTNQATSVTWMVGDGLDTVVRSLRDKGVSFEHYDMPGMKLEGDVHVGHGMRVAWFKDPDGNIHNLASR